MLRISALLLAGALSATGVVSAQQPGAPGQQPREPAQQPGQPMARPAAEPAAVSPSVLCAEPLSSALYCMELFPTARASDATAVVELGRAASPFQVAVTPDGRLEYELRAWIEGLPVPSSLGPYTAYVAWVAPLDLFPVERLGVVSNGENALGRVSLNKFLVMISAEADPDVAEREGPLILRGRSPSSRLEAHDMLAQAPSAEQVPGGDRRVTAGEGAGPEHRPGAAGHPDRAGAHGHAAIPGSDALDWTPPPMYPGIPMLPGVMALEPRVRPLRALAAGMATSILPEGATVSSLPEVRPAQVVELPDGGTLDLEAGFVRRRLGNRELVMLAFNGQQPGPLLRVRQASTIFVNFTNRTPFPTSVHWHGLRLDNRFDGVPGVTQEAVPPGGSFRYQVYFPDPGIYWYHPHHREDVQQELGLYGNMLVDPPDPDHYGPVNREEVLILDDLLLHDAGVSHAGAGGEAAGHAAAAGAAGNGPGGAGVPGGIPAFGAGAATHALMGRFGTVPLVNGEPVLVNGEPGWSLDVARGEVVRFFLTNASNTRTFNVSFVPAVPLKLVASDVGRFEREEPVSSVVLAPAERYVVEARFAEPGRYALMNRVQAINHRLGIFVPEEMELGAVRVGHAPVEEDHAHAFVALREHGEVMDEIDHLRPRFDDEPDLRLDLALEADSVAQPVRDAMRYDRVYANPVEWAGTMPVMNWASTAEEVHWILRDPDTGRENMEIDWRFRVGDMVKIRIRNRRDVFHAMQHPLHIHGQRFLVLSQNGEPTRNLVWKDTVLLPAGSTTDILLELSNPGRWMVHCHIAEHLEAGMKFVLDVEER